MAALRHGVSTVIIPYDNLPDLEEIDQTVRNSLKFVAARNIETVLETALVRSNASGAAILTEIPDKLQTRSRKPSLRQ